MNSHVRIVPGESRPILVIGMHRSGTRLLADLLGRLGVFMGADLQADSESVTFMLQNETILHHCGAFWSEPMAAHFVLAESSNVAQLAAHIKVALAQEIHRYIGQKQHDLEAQDDDDRPFGWKDPRNTFALPVWRELFPNLKVIHLLRHGIDVAASLSRRHREALQSATREQVPPALTVIRDHALGILSTRRGWTLAEALTMWEQYVEKARHEAAAIEGRSLEIRFEDLIAKPEATITKLARFCRAPGGWNDTAFLSRFNLARSYAYRHDPELVDFARANRVVLERFGYSA